MFGDKKNQPEGTLARLPVSAIEPDPEQPRTQFDQQKLQELADSVLACGLAQPISVRKDGERYLIIAGERRWRAHQLAGLTNIDAIIRDESPSNSPQQLAENIFREDLNPYDKAVAVQNRIAELDIEGKGRERFCAELGVSSSWISKALAPLKLREDILALVKENLVRDYALCKKLDKLRGDRRQRAIEQIRVGTFNSVDFFKRKRPERENVGETADEKGHSGPVAVPRGTNNGGRRAPRATLPRDLLVSLLDRAGFGDRLDEELPDWRAAPETSKQALECVTAWLSDGADL